MHCYTPEIHIIKCPQNNNDFTVTGSDVPIIAVANIG